MSYISEGNQLTSTEVAMIQALHALGVSGAGFAITKTGPETFSNAPFGTSSGITILATTSGAVNDTNLVFGFAQKPTIVVVNGAPYRENHGWTWNAALLQATLDYAVGSPGDIYGLI